MCQSYLEREGFMQEYSFLFQIARSAYFAWITLFGLGMLAVSHLFGGDHDHDHDHDHGHDSDHGSGNMSIFSIKVFWMFLVGFGAGGFFSANAGSQVLTASMWGLFGGFIMGAIGYFLMNAFYTRQGNSIIKTSSVVGSIGIVDVAILPGQYGEVRCNVGTHSETFQAQSRIGTPIPISSHVKIVQAIGSTLVVEPESH